MEHVNTQINDIFVMYLSAEKVIRPRAPTDVSVCKRCQVLEILFPNTVADL